MVVHVFNAIRQGDTTPFQYITALRQFLGLEDAVKTQAIMELKRHLWNMILDHIFPI